MGALGVKVSAAGPVPEAFTAWATGATLSVTVAGADTAPDGSVTVY